MCTLYQKHALECWAHFCKSSKVSFQTSFSPGSLLTDAGGNDVFSIIELETPPMINFEFWDRFQAFALCVSVPASIILPSRLTRTAQHGIREGTSTLRKLSLKYMTSIVSLHLSYLHVVYTRINKSYNDLHLLHPLRYLPLEDLKLSIQSDFASGSRLMGIFRIYLMIYFLECTQRILCC